jgi:uncharacterized protein with HEPN domain
VADTSREQFLKSKLIRAGVLQKLITIGEAASRLDNDLRRRHPQIPWKEIRDFRNIAVHNYAGIDYEIVWQTASADVPALRSQIAAVVRLEQT